MLWVGEYKIHILICLPFGYKFPGRESASMDEQDRGVINVTEKLRAAGYKVSYVELLWVYSIR